MESVKFLCKYITVVFLTIIGFPSWAQGVLGESARGISGVVSREISLTEALARASRTPSGIFPTQALPLASSVFRARPKGHPHGQAYSGTVFKIKWKGQEEIYGVIAAHTISSESTEIALGRSFIAEVFKDGQFVSVPAEIVRASSSKMLDIALVKFRPEDEKLFLPLTLAAQGPAKGTVLQGLGFSNNQLIWLPDRTLLENTPVSLKTDLFVLRPNRYGLCGSPLLNSKGEIVAIHTGSSRAMDPADDVGFGTKAVYARLLVKAYHEGRNQVTFPLYLGEHLVAQLSVNEFISRVYFRNEEGNLIGRWDTTFRFPYGLISSMIPHARYVELFISRVEWTGNFLAEDPFFVPRVVRYDLKEKKIITQEKANPFPLEMDK